MTHLYALGQVIYHSYNLHTLSHLLSQQGNLRRVLRLYVRRPASPMFIRTHLLNLGLEVDLLLLDRSLRLNPLHRGLSESPLLLSHIVRILRIRQHS